MCLEIKILSNHLEKIMKISLKKNLLIIAFLLYLPTNSVFSQAGKAEFWKPLFEQGFIYMQQGKIDQAEAQFKKIIAQDEKIPEGYYGLGLIYNRKEPGSKTAEKNFKKAIKLRKDFALAYYQLAEVYRNRNKLKDARENLQKALEINPSLANAWLELVDIQEQLIHDDESIVNVLQEAFKNVPNNPTLSAKYVNACAWYDREKQGIKVLRNLDKKQLNIPENLFQLAQLEYLQDNYPESVKILDSLQIKFPRFSKCRVNLLMAKNEIGLNNVDQFQKFYETALSNIKTKRDASAIFNDLSYIMNNSEYDELQKTPLAKLPEFYGRFWLARDPNHATRINERMSEHYKRLAYARKNYRRYTKNPEKYENVYAMEHPYALYNAQGTRLIKEAYFPKALPPDRAIDDLGVIYIRHGDPDIKVTSPSGIPTYVNQDIVNEKIQARDMVVASSIFEDLGGDTTVSSFPGSYDISSRPVSGLRVPRAYMGETLYSPGYFNNLPMNISWKYYRRHNRPEMIFHFKKYLGVMGWMIEAIPYTVADREILGAVYQQLGQESFSDQPNENMVTKFSNEIKETSEKDLETGLTKETSNYTFPGKPLQVPLELLSFKFRQNNDLIELYYGLDGSEVALTEADSGNYIDLTKFVGIYDEKWNVVRNLKRDDKIKVNQTLKHWPKFAGVDVARFAIKPGKYHYEIQIKDNTSGKLGVFRGDIAIDDYWQNDLNLSDIILSGKIKPVTNQLKFRKEDISYSPHMFTPFHKGEMVGIYFEVYNLLLNNDLETNFRITSTLKPADKNNSPATIVSGFFKSILGDSKGEVGTSYDYSGKNKDEKIYLNFEIGDKQSGNYQLIIETEDLNSGTKVTKSVNLAIS